LTQNYLLHLLNLKFLFKLLHNLIDCPEILERINFRVTLFNSKSKCPFYLSNVNTNYISNYPANVLMSTGNSINNLDLFNITLENLINYFLD